MNDSKLQELIETLRKQGVETGEQAGRQIVEEARTQAAEILRQAEQQAGGILGKARDEADRTMKQLRSSLEIAASQFLTSFKRSMEEDLLAIPLRKEVTGALSETSFVKGLIAICVREFARRPGHFDLIAIVPEQQQRELAEFALQLVRSEAKGGNQGHFKLHLQGGEVAVGFLMGKQDDHVMLDFTDEAFVSLFVRYLTPRFREFFRPIQTSDISAG